MDDRSTKDLYTDNGQYTQQRLEVHRTIINELIEGLSAATNQPVVHLMGGGTASGKSALSGLMINGFKSERESVLVIDSDRIKSMLPEYTQLQQRDPEKTASILHDESSDISEKLYMKATENKLNIIFDGTMKNREKYERYIDIAKSNGYKVSGVLADVPLEEAYRRENIRFLKEQRRVPAEIVKESHAMVPVTFHHIKDKLDSFFLYDMSERHPAQFYVKDNNQIRVLDEERLASFYAKGDLEADQWIKLEKPIELKELIKQAKGMPTGAQVTAELLKSPVQNYKVDVVNGREVMNFRLQDGKKTFARENALFIAREEKSDPGSS
ncbi:zeta toxin family protein [Bacillus sp. FJAT-28004]|uniref:zeta toxin family protein n=1 Tax=Bacillus sp. FJAT-28004 TaxID=1679165 RepID=UPI0006B64A1C|nr:zeta toxin family protein [Bacillus sp. FJAT-28004]